jgi:hypothetical protein
VKEIWGGSRPPQACAPNAQAKRIVFGNWRDGRFERAALISGLPQPVGCSVMTGSLSRLFRLDHEPPEFDGTFCKAEPGFRSLRTEGLPLGSST